MNRLSENKIIIVKRKTRLDELIVRFNTIAQAKFYIEHLNTDFTDYQKEHDCYNSAVAQACESLSSLGRVQVIDRSFVPNFIFGNDDIIVVIGQDGLVANTMKYLDHQVLIGVNPDPMRWDGILLPFNVKDLTKIVPEVFENKRPIKEVSMAKAHLNDGQVLYAVNDLFIGQKTHVSARYNIKLGRQEEPQSSSGIIISTGLGSTGWLKSVLTGATGITKCFLNKNFKIDPDKKESWDADYLFFTVREPFPSKFSKANLVFGKIVPETPLIIVSQMPENGVIFSDGVESDFLEFRSGLIATISLADKKGRMIV